VWATCLFADSIADIAVLGQPDNQALSDETDAYDEQVEDMTTLAVADAPAQGSERLTFGERQVNKPTPRAGPARVLSLKGRWLQGHVERRGSWLKFKPQKYFASGMSGSAAIGIVSVDILSPVLLDNLATRLAQGIVAKS